MEHYTIEMPLYASEIDDVPAYTTEWLGFNHDDPNASLATFDEYPFQHGWTPADLDALWYGKVDQMSHTLWEAMSMLQSWLFLGVLEAFFKKRMLEKDFLELDENSGKVLVTTKQLYFLLRDFGEAEEEEENKPEDEQKAAEEGGTTGEEKQTDQNTDQEPTSKPDKETAKKEYEAILRRVDRWNEHLRKYSAEKTHSPFERIIRLNTLVCESLQAIIREPGEDVAGQNSFSYTKLGTEELREKLTKKGWCPNMAEKLISYGFSVAEYALLLKWPTDRRVEKHSQCSQERCVGNNVDEDDYQVRHVTDDCKCEFVKPSFNRVTEMLKDGKVPVVDIVALLEGTSDAVLCIDPENPADNPGYLTISHVWADGLGSNTEAGLPLCQCQRIASLVEILNSDLPVRQTDRLDSKSEERWKNRKPIKGVWMDSLCVPHDPHTRKIAIGLMAKTYKLASATIVLDSGLVGGDLWFMGRPADEMRFRIVTSNWMSRLWTLQEGRFSQDLYFQFRTFNGLTPGESQPTGDRLVSYMDLMHQLYKATAVSITFFRELSLLYGEWDLEIDGLERILRYRQTSRASDEAVVLASITGVDMQHFLSLPIDQRIPNFWLHIKHFLSTTLIGMFPRLDQPGFRWAPRTLMGRSPGPHAAVLGMRGGFEAIPERYGKCTENGLEVLCNVFPWNEKLKTTERKLVRFYDSAVEAMFSIVAWAPFEGKEDFKPFEWDAIIRLPRKHEQGPETGDMGIGVAVLRVDSDTDEKDIHPDIPTYMFVRQLMFRVDRGILANLKVPIEFHEGSGKDTLVRIC